MEKSKLKVNLFISIIPVVSFILLAINQSKEISIRPIAADTPSYTITMNSDNAPSVFGENGVADKVIRNTIFEYQGGVASTGNHIQLDETQRGGLWNSKESRITSITSITVDFVTTTGSLELWTAFDLSSGGRSVNLTSGVTKHFSSLPYYFELWAYDDVITIETIIITYSCSPHEQSLDTYEITWLDEDETTVLEFDSEVLIGTMPTFDGEIPSKPDDIGGGQIIQYQFVGWSPEIVAAGEDTSYVIQYAIVTYDIYINDETETECTLYSIDSNFQTDVTIPNTYLDIPITGIDAYALSFSTVPLISVTMSDSITSINDMAFTGADALQSVHIPQNVSHIGIQAFGWCHSLTNFTVDENNLFYKSIDGVLFDYLGETLIAYPENRADVYAIPLGTITITSYAFVANTKITSVAIPNSVEIIQDGAFGYTDSLLSIVIPISVHTMGMYVFDTQGLTINCVASERPLGWSEDWAWRPAAINWGYVAP